MHRVRLVWGFTGDVYLAPVGNVSAHPSHTALKIFNRQSAEFRHVQIGVKPVMVKSCTSRRKKCLCFSSLQVVLFYSN